MSSPSEARKSPSGGLPARAVRNQLEKILASEIFSRSERLSAFLRFVVEQALAGKGETLKEQVLAAELYSKRPSSSTDDDPVVRVDARRLRDKLREFYAESDHEPVIISLPKGSYTPVFDRNPAAIPPVAPLPIKPEPVQESAVRPMRVRWPWIIGAAAVAIIAGLVVLWA